MPWLFVFCTLLSFASAQVTLCPEVSGYGSCAWDGTTLSGEVGPCEHVYCIAPGNFYAASGSYSPNCFCSFSSGGFYCMCAATIQGGTFSEKLSPRNNLETTIPELQTKRISNPFNDSYHITPDSQMAAFTPDPYYCQKTTGFAQCNVSVIEPLNECPTNVQFEAEVNECEAAMCFVTSANNLYYLEGNSPNCICKFLFRGDPAPHNGALCMCYPSNAGKMNVIARGC